jgi:Glycosyltransferase like family 2
VAEFTAGDKMSDLRQASRTAPVIVFAYARPDHLRRTVESLLANPESADSEVFFFCDGAKRAEHAPQVQAVREFVDSVGGFKSVTRVYRDVNLGLAASVIDGVTRVLASHGRVIVVEDDLLLSPHFLRYMNEALDCYADDEQVASIHGYCHPVSETLPETFFLRGADCWGWATWKRAWSHFRADGVALLAELEARNLTQAFDFDGQYAYTRMLRDQITGRNDSWAIRWHASCYLDELLTLYPGRSLVHNIGNDGSGTHSHPTSRFDQSISDTQVTVARLLVSESSLARSAIVGHLRYRHHGWWREPVHWFRRQLAKFTSVS